MKIGALDSVGGIITEMTRLYRQARRGEVSTADAARLAGILVDIRRAIESDEIETRLEALERARAESNGAAWARQ